MNGTENRIPASLIPAPGSVKVSIVSPEAADAAGVEKLIKGREVLATPLLFKLEQINADKTTTELKHFGKTHVSEFVTVDAKR